MLEEYNNAVKDYRLGGFFRAEGKNSQYTKFKINDKRNKFKKEIKNKFL